MKLAAAFLLIGTAYVLNVSGLKGGFENFLCTKVPGTKVLAPCDVDCQHQHGALTGVCPTVDRDNFNCKCKGRSKLRYEESLMCGNRTDGYREVCNIDCICNHGAKGGYCDWDLKACICRGENDNNVNCPYDNVPDFSRFVYSRIGAAGLGPNGMYFVNAAIEVKKPHTRQQQRQIQRFQ